MTEFDSVRNPGTVNMYIDWRSVGLTKEGFPPEYEEIVLETDPRLDSVCWGLGQTSMVGNIIKPIDQSGAKKGEIRIIKLAEVPFQLNCEND